MLYLKVQKGSCKIKLSLHCVQILIIFSPVWIRIYLHKSCVKLKSYNALALVLELHFYHVGITFLFLWLESGEQLLPKAEDGDEEDESPFLTLEEAEEMAKECAERLHIKKKDQVIWLIFSL